MPRYKKVPLDKLIVDPAYQRELDEKRVEKIVTEFDPALLGTLEVSVRNGKSAVFDGQHRLAALKEVGETSAPCLVHEGLSVPEEAMLFVRLQTERRALKPLDRFKARLRAGEEEALEIAQAAKDAGYVISSGGGDDNRIGAVTALDRVYQRGGPPLLQDALFLLSTWKGEPGGTDGALIEGLGIFIDSNRGPKAVAKQVGLLVGIKGPYKKRAKATA